MTIKELKDKIRFRTQDDGAIIHLEARLACGVEEAIDRQEYFRLSSRQMDEVKEDLREMLIRRLYDDIGREMHEAIMELHHRSPNDFRGYHEQIDKILALSRYQPPKP
jgi:predicted GNAT family acetyltransferase